MTFGEVLDQLMTEKDVKTVELSKLSGVSKQTITELRKGRSKEPTFSKAKALADGLGVSLQYFVDRTSED